MSAEARVEPLPETDRFPIEKYIAEWHTFFGTRLSIPDEFLRPSDTSTADEARTLNEASPFARRR